MGIFSLYSYRKQEADRCGEDIYRYDILPNELRVQIVHIWNDALGRNVAADKGWKTIHDVISRELGTFELADGNYYYDRCMQYFLSVSSVERALDVVEFSFRYLESRIRMLSKHNRMDRGITQSIESAVAELNERFKRAAVGYQYENGIIVRIDSALIHSEVVRPALKYLHQQ